MFLVANFWDVPDHIKSRDGQQLRKSNRLCFLKHQSRSKGTRLVLSDIGDMDEELVTRVKK